MATIAQSHCLYQILKKHLKNLCIRDYKPFSVTILSIYNLQLGFRQQYSTSHALINITENIWKALDDGNIGCGVFWYCRPPDTASNNESLWDSRSFKWLV